MITAARRLETILGEILEKLFAYSEEQASVKPASDKWSRKEILGHLVDSACNNHQRFVRMQLEHRVALPAYAQNEWVERQRYQTRSWREVVELWAVYNRHLLHVLKNADESKLTNTAVFPEYERTLQFLIDDYVDHLEHHLKQAMSRTRFDDGPERTAAAGEEENGRQKEDGGKEQSEDQKTEE